MPPKYHYPYDCTLCFGEEPEFKSDEGRAKRRSGLRQYGSISNIQAPLGVLAAISGATTVGLAISNPSYPYLSCFPLVCGLLMLISAYFGYLASAANADNEVPVSLKRNIVIHYHLAVWCCSLSGVAMGHSAWGLRVCIAGNTDKCKPNRDIRMGFAVADIVCSFFLILVSIYGIILFYKYARAFGLELQPEVQSEARSCRFEQLESEVRTLRAQMAESEVRTLRAQMAAVSVQAQGGQSPPPLAPPLPPPYSYSVPDTTLSSKYGMTEDTQYY